MRRVLCLILMLCAAPSAFPQERVKARSDAVAYSTRDATVLSMVGWGVILGVITAGVSVLFSDASSNTTHSH